MLAGFEISSTTLRRDYNRKKGYKRSDFEDAFTRYLTRKQLDKFEAKHDGKA